MILVKKRLNVRHGSFSFSLPKGSYPTAVTETWPDWFVEHPRFKSSIAAGDIVMPPITAVEKPAPVKAEKKENSTTEGKDIKELPKEESIDGSDKDSSSKESSKGKKKKEKR